MNKNIRQYALHSLTEFINSDLKEYSSKRNYDYGPNNRKNTSNLSKFITHGILTEKEIIKHSLAKFKYEVVEKFIQEILWRIYWKGWLEKRSAVWSDYLKNLNKLKKELNCDQNYTNAINGNTDISCFNDWIHELKKYGYLHNHTRMWFASIWIFTLKLPWELGAEIFMKYLYDGDYASNTLSWRWVAGLQTKGKHYVAQSWNIQKFTNNKYSNIKLVENPLPMNENQIYKEAFLDFQNIDVKQYDNFVIFENNLSAENFDLFLDFKNIFIVKNINHRKLDYDKKVMDFKTKLIEDQLSRIENVKPVQIIDISELKKIDISKSISLYPNVGENLDYLIENNIQIKFIYRTIDLVSYQFCNKGYFNFKRNIPFILKKIVA